MSKRKKLTDFPELVALWHPTKNGNLTPEMVYVSDRRKVWWFMSYDDDRTGKHFDFEWEMTVDSMAKSRKCPYLTGHRVWPGFNDLATRRPDITEQWHPTKNGDLTPDQVTEFSNRKVWWIYSYYDPAKKRTFVFEWEAEVFSRVNYPACPFLTGRRVWPGFNDLLSQYPDLAKQWHPTKNGNLKPDQIHMASGKSVWWQYIYYDPQLKKQFNFEWQSPVWYRVKQGMDWCPFVNGSWLWPGFNDLKTRYPDIAAQWHPTKNGDLTPDQVFMSTNQSVWWMYSYDDQNLQRHFEFVWECPISYRVSQGADWCPFVNGTWLWPGFNDLKTRYPDIAAQWHPTMNGALTPDHVFMKSAESVWWRYPYYDPDLGKHFEFTWKSRVGYRVEQGANWCPYIHGVKVWPGFNDLATRYPDLATQWDADKNFGLTPRDVHYRSNARASWKMPYDDPVTGHHFEFEWTEKINDRVKNGASRCPYLYVKKVWPGYNDLASVCPKLSEEYNTELNHTKPGAIRYSTNKKVWWTCSKCGHIWKTSVSARVKFGSSCPKCVRTKKYK